MSISRTTFTAPSVATGKAVSAAEAGNTDGVLSALNDKAAAEYTKTVMVAGFQISQGA